MRSWARLIAIALLLSAATADASKLIAVLPLDVSKTEGAMSKSAQTALEEMLRQTAGEALGAGWTVATADATAEAVKKQGSDWDKCIDEKCRYAVARAMLVDAFISGSVEFVSSSFKASLQLFDPAVQKVTASETVEGASVKARHKDFQDKAKAFLARGGLATAQASASSDGASDELRTKAVALAKKGASLYDSGKFKSALAKFEEAYRTFPTPPLLLNLSRTQVKLERCEDAVASADHYSADAPGKESFDWSTEVHNRCPEIEVNSEPAGASVWLNSDGGKAKGVTPWKARLSPDDYTIIAKLNGYANARQHVTMEVGKPQTIALKLVAQATTGVASNSDPPPVFELPGDAPDAGAATPAPATAAAPVDAGKTLEHARKQLASGDFAGALDEYEKVLNDQPTLADALFGKGMALLGLNRDERAITILRFALDAAPESGPTLIGLAQAYRKNHDNMNSATYYKKYLDKYPQGFQASEALDFLKTQH